MHSHRSNYGQLQSPLPTKICAAWVYGALHHEHTFKVIAIQPALFVPMILAYNKLATPLNKLTYLYTYGGSIEMSCLGSGESDTSLQASRETLQFYYDEGLRITDAFCKASSDYKVVPVVDGAIGAEELKTFNQLPEKAATLFATIITEKLFANDDRIPGAQFDILPFNSDMPGQINFYKAVAKCFYEHPTAKNTAYPLGRFFSIFTGSSQINATLASILNGYNNGYAIISLYDLGDAQTNSPDKYAELVDIEIKKTIVLSQKFNVKFQFAIPACATTKEHERVMGVTTGYKQVDFVKIANEAIEKNNVYKNSLYLGLTFWGFCHTVPVNGKSYHPAAPNSETLHYLANKK